MFSWQTWALVAALLLRGAERMVVSPAAHGRRLVRPDRRRMADDRIAAFDRLKPNRPRTTSTSFSIVIPTTPAPAKCASTKRDRPAPSWNGNSTSTIKGKDAHRRSVADRANVSGGDQSDASQSDPRHDEAAGAGGSLQPAGGRNGADGPVPRCWPGAGSRSFARKSRNTRPTSLPCCASISPRPMRCGRASRSGPARCTGPSSNSTATSPGPRSRSARPAKRWQRCPP